MQVGTEFPTRKLCCLRFVLPAVGITRSVLCFAIRSQNAHLPPTLIVQVKSSMSPRAGLTTTFIIQVWKTSRPLHPNIAKGDSIENIVQICTMYPSFFD